MKTLLKTFNPAYFSMVMATGIVAIAAHDTGFVSIGFWLSCLNFVFAAILYCLYILRLSLFKDQILADLRDPRRSVGFMTLVAGSCILGDQSLLIFEWSKPAIAFLIFGSFLWWICLYGVLGFLTLAPKDSSDHPNVAQTFHGGWLLLVVATQAVVVLAVSLLEQLGSFADIVLFTSLCLWLVAGMLYVWLITLILFRYSVYPMNREDVLPPYWINMGAMAISTLAGCVLLIEANEFRLIQDLRVFITGVTLLFWAIATWWIPFLVILGVWRHGAQRVAIRYDPSYWSLVFPLGMYTVCTLQLDVVMNQISLSVIPELSIYFALFAWGLTCIGVLRRSGLILLGRYNNN